jgi:hypothetical protein
MSMNTRGILTTAVAIALAAGLACGRDDGTSGPDGPTPGFLTVTLTTPSTDDGALLLTVSGPDITQVAATDASLYFRHIEAGSTMTAVLVGNVQGGTLLRFHVPDVAAAGSYSTTITQVADRGNARRASLAGYALMVQ